MTAVIVNHIVATTGADLNHLVLKILKSDFIVGHHEHNHHHYSHHCHNIHPLYQRRLLVLRMGVLQELGMFLKAS